MVPTGGGRGLSAGTFRQRRYTVKKSGFKIFEFCAAAILVALLVSGTRFAPKPLAAQTTTSQVSWQSGGQDFLHLSTLGKYVFWITGQGQTFAGTNLCSVNSISPAACGASWLGAVVIPTTTTTYTINTTGVTANSVITLTPRTFAGNLPSTPTCVAPASGPIYASTVTAGTSFVVTLPSTSGTVCLSFRIDD